MGKYQSGIIKIYPLPSLKRNVLSLMSVFFIFTAGNVAFSEEPPQETTQNKSQGANAQEIQSAFEKAMKEVNRDKAEKEKAEADKVNGIFNEVADKWLYNARDTESANLGKFVKQNWERLFKVEYFVRFEFNPRPPEPDPFVHYDYYLRDFEFIENARGVVKTDALTSPYKGHIDITEKRYVERYHTPNISYIENFLFTINTPIRVNFEYRDNDFVVTSTDIGTDTMDRGWPQKVRDKILRR